VHLQKGKEAKRENAKKEKFHKRQVKKGVVALDYNIEVMPSFATPADNHPKKMSQVLQ
jgi:hypothetical protein